MKATILAYWLYTGEHINGEDKAIKGDLNLAYAAGHYYNKQGVDDSLVQRVSPSRAGIKSLDSDFGRTVCYRVTDIDALKAWGKEYWG